MKKLSLVFVVLLIATANVLSQSAQIKCIAYKQIYRANGVWGQWPSYWNTYSSEGVSDPILRITEISKNPYVYQIRLFKNGSVITTLNVRFDPARSIRIRREWNDEVINCYVDNAGDYLYTEGCSLEQLTTDANVWARYSDAKIYFWLFSQNTAIVVK